MPKRSTTKKKLHFFGKILIFINWLIAIALIFSGFAHLISPEKFVIAAFFGIAFPYFALANLLFIIYWLLRRRWQFLFSFAAILITWTTVSKFITFNLFSQNTKASQNYFKVLTYNVHVFDIYNYDKHWISNPYKRNRIFEQISYSSPDIICLQEFVDDKGGKFKILDTLPLFQKAKNFHFEYSKNVRNLNFFGIATFSKYPIISKGRINFPNSKNNLCIYTDINADGKIIRVYNMHLQSIRFNEENYEFADKLRNINNINPDEKFKAESKKILRRLKKGFLKRAPQSEIIAEHIKTSPYPFIICGDFNDTPSSYSYYKISDNLSDAFSESGNGLGLTYAGGSFPAFRIDYILHSPSLKSYGYKCERVYYSDHFPVECYISF